MPFDCPPKDVSPAQRLAALIEAGVAANPDLKPEGGRVVCLERHTACALGYAMLAAGASREELNFPTDGVYRAGKRVLGMPISFFSSATLTGAIATAFDDGASLPEICESLRSGELSKIPA